MGLFDDLRSLSPWPRLIAQTVVVTQPVGAGIAIAIRDRLKRAAHSGSRS